MSPSEHASPTDAPAPDARAYDAEPFLPSRGGLPAHRRAAADCRGCPLHEDATQTVFGKGDGSARLLLVGEQPGDQEDRQGEPFVGPAGRLLRRALPVLLVPWLLAELRLVRPEIVVALGATAGKALLGGSFRVTKDRGALLPLPAEEAEGARVVATLHPSAVLRADDRDA
ncbi:uracil-DNA glycosylase family protein, partial [Streptomyces caniscabiei]|uniref:uracil-DNA glycosylase family protein n=1 Tax=Streptomyces caniscabiei TaxID=2746961 RepID=UPI000A35D7DD